MRKRVRAARARSVPPQPHRILQESQPQASSTPPAGAVVLWKRQSWQSHDRSAAWLRVLASLLLSTGCTPRSLELLGDETPGMSPSPAETSPADTPTPPEVSPTATLTATPTSTPAPTPTATPSPTPVPPTPSAPPFLDEDGDGFASNSDNPETLDCDDHDPNVYPTSIESCDLKDNDCDGTIDEDFTPDGDGDGVKICRGDCDDGDPLRFPGAFEVCDGIDTNCSGGDADFFISLTAPADSTEIQYAVERAGQGCIIEVDDGTYTGSVVLQGIDITLISSHGPEATILQGDGMQPVIQVVEGSGLETLISGFTITGGYGIDRGVPKANRGGGIELYFSSATLEHLIIEDNAADYGAGMAVDSGTIVLRNSTIWNNTSRITGGGAYLYGGATLEITGNHFEGNISQVSNSGKGGGLAIRSFTSGHVSDNVFTGNSAYGGGAILIEGNLGLTLEHNTIEGNSAQSNGAGLVSYQNSDNSLILENIFRSNTAPIGAAVHLYAEEGKVQSQKVQGNLFEDNVGSTLAGALYCGRCAITVTQNIFRNNQSQSNNANGGALFIDDGAPVIQNNLFEANFATYGGALAVDQGSTNARILNNTFVRNKATRGGGIYFYAANPTIDSNLFTLSDAAQEAYCEQPNTSVVQSRIRFNDFYSGQSGNPTNIVSLIGNNGNLNADPRYEDPFGDYRLSPGSPAIDTGAPETSANDSDGTRNDMGVTGGPSGWIPVEPSFTVLP